MRRYGMRYTSLALLLVLAACDSPLPQPVDQAFSSTAQRQVLTAPQLLQGFQARSPVDEAALTPPPDAAAPQHTFEGRLELLHYVQNQSICNNYHRYGNLGERTEL